MDHRLAALAPDDLDAFKRGDVHPPTLLPHTAVCSCGHTFNADSYNAARLCWRAHASSDVAKPEHPRSGDIIAPGVMLCSAEGEEVGWLYPGPVYDSAEDP